MLQLVPQLAIPEDALQLALKAIVDDIAESLQAQTEDVVNEWAELSGLAAPNIFMKEKVLAVLAARLLCFVEEVQPTASQWTADHVEAYQNLPLLPPPSAKDPEPLEPRE